MNQNSITQVGAVLKPCARSLPFWGEKNDCTVRALAVAASIEYDRAHEVARIAGRKNGEGHFLHPIIESAMKAGVKFEKAWETGQKQRNGCDITVKRFVETKEPGRYIVQIRGHAIGIIITSDRKVEVSDAHWGKYSTVLRAWKFVEKI